MREYVVPEGMARAVFDSKYARKKPDGTMQTWAERLEEVVMGNFSLVVDTKIDYGYTGSGRSLRDYERTLELAVAGVMPTSGRHLQQGDFDQSNKILELFSNCTTALFSFMSFRLLLRGCGVGRDFSSECCRVDWNNMPDIRLVLDEAHSDFNADMFRGAYEPLRNARHKYDSSSEKVRWFTVDDSREGWSKTIEILETAAWQGKHADKLFIFDFSNVRPNGAPIMGLQGRPASGPVSLMNALANIYSIKNAGMKPWKQALFIDHYTAACVQLGGVRRSARMATKSWRDRDILEFIDIKRGGFLWSANNSILVDKEFWESARKPQHTHGRRVFEAAVNAAYWDGTGEPGFINVDQLNCNTHGMNKITAETYINKKSYVDLHRRTTDMIDNILSYIKQLKYPFIVNPCGEIVLSTYGGYCIIGDVCLAQCEALGEALDAAGLMAKFLVRTNLMQSDYASEVARTNRIGVSLTGIHEFAWTHFGLTFYDLIGDYNGKGYCNDPTIFWDFIDILRVAAEKAATEISNELGMVTPHTVTCIKPSGTISKVMNCTEGAHLPAYSFYMRWVQYKVSDPDLMSLAKRGYPVKDISNRYPEHLAVGFPTKHSIVDLMGTENVVTADEITPEQNFEWLRLLEKHWLGGEQANNQISYTLKYSQDSVSYLEFMDMILTHQPNVRCCAVMPQSDWRKSAEIYGYVPEEPITEAEYNNYMLQINPVTREGFDDDMLMCEGGACPVEISVNPTTLL